MVLRSWAIKRHHLPPVPIGLPLPVESDIAQSLEPHFHWRTHSRGRGNSSRVREPRQSPASRTDHGRACTRPTILQGSRYPMCDRLQSSVNVDEFYYLFWRRRLGLVHRHYIIRCTLRTVQRERFCHSLGEHVYCVPGPCWKTSCRRRHLVQAWKQTFKGPSDIDINEDLKGPRAVQRWKCII